jgi:hypothetical protein
LAGPLFTAVPAHAAGPYVVDSLLDTPGLDGTLRKEIEDANDDPGAQTITFAAPALSGIIELGPGQLAITDDLTITGPGRALTVDANGANRVFYVSPADNILMDVTITGLTVTGGVSGDSGGGVYVEDTNLTLVNVVITGNTATSGGGGVYLEEDGSFTMSDSVVSDNHAGGSGGGLYLLPSGPVTISRTILSGNTATGTGGALYLDIPEDQTSAIVDSVISGNTADDSGGGVYAIWFHGTDTGELLIERTTVSGNTSYGGGGGIYLARVRGEALILDSTLSGNHADSDGGGLYVAHFGETGDLVTVAHSTVTGNSAGDDPLSAQGGGIYTDEEVALDHTIVADNTVYGGGPDLLGPFAVRFSLIEDPSDATINDLGGNVFNSPPVLGPLAANGGLTPTHLPGPTSPAVNAGDPSFSPPPATDQRGRPRVAAGRIDIGAVERQTTSSLPGVVLSSTSWTLRDVLSAGPPTIGPFTYGITPLVPIMGDWDGDGVSTPGVFKAGVFQLNNQNDSSGADITFTFGNTQGFPVVGDWDGNGKDEVAVFRNGTWQERSDTNASPASTPTYSFGPATTWPAVWPVAGDWDGNGTDGIGTYVPATGVWNLRNTSDAGSASIGPFTYIAGTGTPRPGIVGDWDGDGDDTVGVRNGTTWYLNNQNDSSAADVTFAFGGLTPNSEFPVVWGTP